MAEIVKVTVKMGKVDVEMSVDEAKDLRRVLNELFGPCTSYPIVIEPWPRPYPWTYTTTGDSMVITNQVQ